MVPHYAERFQSLSSLDISRPVSVIGILLLFGETNLRGGGRGGGGLRGGGCDVNNNVDNVTADKEVKCREMSCE